MYLFTFLYYYYFCIQGCKKTNLCFLLLLVNFLFIEYTCFQHSISLNIQMYTFKPVSLQISIFYISTYFKYYIIIENIDFASSAFYMYTCI